jgi:hypothetical protein
MRQVSAPVWRSTARRAVLPGGLEAPDELADGRREQLLRGGVAEHPRGGLVGVDERPFGVLDGDGLGERRQRRGELGLHRLELGEQPGVVERERGAAAEHLRELDVVAVVAPAGVRRRDERQRPEPAAPRAQGHGDAREDPERAQAREVLVVGRKPPQHVVGDRRQEPRLLGIARLVDRPRGAGGEHRGARVPGGAGHAHGEALQLALAHRVDDADVGDRRHDEVVEPGDGVLERARPVGDLGDPRQHGEALAVARDLRAIAGREAREDADDRGDGDAVDPDAVPEVVAPDAAQHREQDRGAAHDGDVAGAAEQRRQQRRDDDEADDRRLRLGEDVDQRERARDRQAGRERQDAVATSGRQPEPVRRWRRHAADDTRRSAGQRTPPAAARNARQPPWAVISRASVTASASQR